MARGDKTRYWVTTVVEVVRVIIAAVAGYFGGSV